MVYNIRSVTFMKLNEIEQVLLKRGGMLSTDLKEYLMNNPNISADTARKRISRAEFSSANICKLKGLAFRNRAVFYYHKSRFGSPYYWESLHEALKRANSVYSFTIAALIARGGVIPKEHFPIQCGAPFRMARNMSFERVLKDLLDVNAIREINIAGVGDCISLIQDDAYVNNGTSIKARLLAEDILINAVSSWLKNLNFGSYDKVVQNREEKHKSVNSFYWDISAPSYLTSLTTITSEQKKPGFVVCDVMLDRIVNEADISPFLNKVKKSQFSRNQGKCLYIFVAQKYTKEAFELAKKAGIIPATTRNLFGKDVEEALKSVIEVFSRLTLYVDAPEKVQELFSKLEKIEGAVGNLRGTLFEFIAAESLRQLYPNVEMGKKIKAITNSKKYDADIFVEKPNETLIIECKSGHPKALLDHNELKRWLHEQVPNMHKTLVSQEAGVNRQYSFEMWSTKELKEESKELLNKVQNSLSKYSINVRTGIEVKQEVAKANKQNLLDLLDQHYL